MANEIIFKKVCGAFIPSEEYYKIYNTLKEGVEYKAVITKPRNLGYHKKYFAFLNCLMDMLDGFPSLDILRYEVLLQAGFYKDHKTVTGTIIPIVDSISFINMDQLEFENVVNKSIDAALKMLAKQNCLSEVQIEEYENILIRFF